MKNGMSLEELRNNLEGDAQQKVLKLETRVKHLELEYHDMLKARNSLHEEIIIREKESYYLFNRCRALSHMTICPFCGIRGRCNDIRYRYAEPKTEKIMDAYLSGNLEKLAEESLLNTCAQVKAEYEATHPEEVLNNVKPD